MTARVLIYGVQGFGSVVIGCRAKRVQWLEMRVSEN